jgi:hypothetical protein
MDVSMRTSAQAILFALLVATAEADTVYNYVGDAFGLIQGVYTPLDRIIGSFVLSDTFVPTPGLEHTITQGVVSYSFTDGHQTLTQANSTGSFSAGAYSNGTLAITPTANGYGLFSDGWWDVNIRTPTSGIQLSFQGDWSIDAWMGGSAPSSFHVCSGTGSTFCFDDPTISTAHIDSFYVGNLPGKWSVQVPEEGSTALFLFASLAGLTILTRFIGLKKVTW